MLGVDIINRFKDGHLVSQYLLASYCYYQLNLSPMTDEAFDRLCVRLIERWDFIDNSVYPHKNLIDYEALSAGSCFLPEYSYPRIVTIGADEYERKCRLYELHSELEPYLNPSPTSRRVARTARAEPVAVPPVVALVTKPGRIVRTPPRGS